MRLGIISIGIFGFTVWAPVSNSVLAVDFLREIQPVFARHCQGCHGEEKQKGALRLDSAAGVRRGGDSGEPLFLAGSA